MKISLLGCAAAFFSLALLSTPASAQIQHGTNHQDRVAIASGSPPIVTGEKAIAYFKETGQYESLASAVANARYGVRAAENSGQRAVAQNPANGMESVFTPDGLSCTVATGGVTHTVRWQLKSLGFGTEQTPVPAGRLHTGGRRVELVRAELKLTEWFCNAPAGLEHGFTLAERPSPNAAGEPLRLVLAVGGDLWPQADAAGQNLMLCDAAGQTVLAYKKLRVWDATGAELKAVMAVNNGNVILSVEESGARYPLTIDPTFEAYMKASNAGSGDRFGNSVAISGDTVVVGAIAEASLNGSQTDNSQSGTGAVYVFVRSGTTWSQQAYLKATPLDANIAFGCSVAISGDTLVVGAYGESRGATGVNGSASFAGAAYVFVRSGTTWSQQAKLKASNIGADDRFAESVSISGDTIVIGSQYEDSAATGVNGDQTSEAATDAGAAYVFVRSGTTWSQQAYLKASNTNANDRFGVSVGVSGDTLVVGANGEASAATTVNGNQGDNTAPGAGAVYVFVRSAGTWSQQAYLKASVNHAGYGLGYSVAISGDTVVAGARGENSAAGAAYVFARSGGIWSQQARLAASNAGSNDQFGGSLAISGDRIVVGASQEASNATGINGDQTNNSDAFAGAAYVFSRTGTTWNQQAYLKAANTDPGDFFGISAGISGDTVVVGAYFEASGASGINGNGVDNTASRAGAAYVYAGFGTSASDFNGDGKDDLVWQNTTTGQRTIWFMNGTTFAGSASLGTVATAWQIAAIGDFNGDGKPDILWQNTTTGARTIWYMNGSTLTGYGSLGTVSTDWQIAGTGDFNGDGKTDIVWQNTITGARTIWYMNGTTVIGYGSLGTVATAWQIAAIGDFNGDGKPDILWQNTVTGARTVWFMNGTTLTGYGSLGVIPTDWQIAGAGDFNGDGKPDIIWQNVVTGQRFIWFMNGTAYAGGVDLGTIPIEWKIRD